MDLNEFEKLSKAAEEARKLVEGPSQALELARQAAFVPSSEMLKAMQPSADIRRMMEEVNRHKDLMKSMEGPLAELRRAGGIFDPSSPLQQELQRTQKMMAEFKERFSLPEIQAAAQLLRQFQVSPLAEVLARYSEQASSLQKAMEAMRTPWLDTQEMLRSMSGFAELQGIGGMLSRLPTFNDQVAQALRVDLGDWRDQITWPNQVLTDFSARYDFYIERGFDPALTNFTEEAFEQSVVIAGLRREPPPLVAAYGEVIPRSVDDEEEDALVRTNGAHDWLLRLETQLRRFVDTEMTRVFGPDWPVRRLPKDMYDKWSEKKKDAEDKGARVWPLIAYADFTDYMPIICKRENWEQVFAPHFRRPESVRETFQRLYPIRLDTMHARPITQEDQLFLYVETRRLVRVIIT